MNAAPQTGQDSATLTVLELRRIEQEIMEHEKALLDLRRKSREVLELTRSRPDSRAVPTREGKQRMLRQMCQRRGA